MGWGALWFLHVVLVACRTRGMSFSPADCQAPIRTMPSCVSINVNDVGTEQAANRISKGAIQINYREEYVNGHSRRCSSAVLDKLEDPLTISSSSMKKEPD